MKDDLYDYIRERRDYERIKMENIRENQQISYEANVRIR